MSDTKVKLFGSAEATLIIGIMFFILGAFFIVTSRIDLPWPASGLMPV